MDMEKIGKKIKISGFAACILVLTLYISACAPKKEIQKVQKEFFALDTQIILTAYGDDRAKEALAEAQEKIYELENVFSTVKEDGETAIINKNSGGKLSEPLLYLAERAIEISRDTEGAFNPMILPVVKLWGFSDKNYRVPEDNEIKSALLLTDLSWVRLDKKSSEIYFDKKGMGIDFGGIAKGYVSSVIMDIYRKNGIESGVVNLGGNVEVLNEKPDGSSYNIGIRSPYDGMLGALSVKDKAVITSGGYERYFEKDKVRYHHIINPNTGYPAESGLISVTIVSKDGVLADALSTALFVMGKDKAVTYWKKNGGEFDIILMDGNDNIYISEGIVRDFKLEGNYRLEVIKKEAE